jgi:hypothetical protein
LVPLNDVGASRAGVVSISVGLSEGTSLPKRIPTTVEADSDRFEPLTIVFGGSVVRFAFQESVFLRHAPFYPSVYLVVVHRSSRLANESGASLPVSSVPTAEVTVGGRPTDAATEHADLELPLLVVGA